MSSGDAATPSVSLGRGGFYLRTLERLLEEGLLDKRMRTLVVAGGRADRDLLAALAFEDVTITNVDEDEDPDYFRPYRWQRADAEELPFANDSFDWAVVNAGLHHCRSPHKALLEMYRVASRGLVAIEARDSLLMRAAIRLKLTDEYELTAVAANDFRAGGVANTGVPNYVYRWTEREVEKTIASFAPHARSRVVFFHELQLSHAVVESRGGRSGRALVRTLHPLLSALVKVFPGQANLFAFAVLKPELPRDLQPWLRLEHGALAPDEEWIRSRAGLRR